MSMIISSYLINHHCHSCNVLALKSTLMVDFLNDFLFRRMITSLHYRGKHYTMMSLSIRKKLTTHKLCDILIYL